MTFRRRFYVVVSVISGMLATGLPSIASAAWFADVHALKVGDCVQFEYLGEWQAAVITGPESAGAYPVQFGAIGSVAITDPNHIRPCPAGTVPLGADSETKAALARLPKGNGLGAQYGTRDPATCANRKLAITAETAKKLLACDSEGELTRDELYLITDEVVQVGAPRAFNYRQDSIATAIDAKQPVYDIRGSYTQYQCSRLSAELNDYAKTHNCFKYPAAPGGVGRCYTDTFGDKHCQMTGGGPTQLKDQMPPPAN
jgi:hypothetical protein